MPPKLIIKSPAAAAPSKKDLIFGSLAESTNLTTKNPNIVFPIKFLTLSKKLTPGVLVDFFFASF